MLEDKLRAAGLRVTRPRLTVLEVVSRAGQEQQHLAAGEVAARAREQLGTVSVQAVYDVLDALTSAGLLRRIEPAGSPARYEARTGDNHHHLVCRACGRIADADCVVGAAPCLAPVDSRGFALDEAEVIFWGLCPTCAAAAEQPTDAHPTTKEIHSQ